MSFPDHLTADAYDWEPSERYECWNCGNDADPEATARVPNYGVVHLCDTCWPLRFSLKVGRVLAPPQEIADEDDHHREIGERIVSKSESRPEGRPS